MWQSNPIERFLADGEGARPIMRASAGNGGDRLYPRTWLSYTSQEGDGQLPPARRKPPQRLADSTIDAQRAASAFIKQFQGAVFILGQDRRVLCLNLAARCLLSRSHCIRIKRNCLSLVNPSGDQALGKFLLTGQHHQVVGNLCLRLAHNGGTTPPLLMTANWLALEGGGSRNAACVTIHQPHVVPSISDHLLISLYGLTRTEAHLTTRLFLEPALEKAARQCSISINTAKTHLKHVFSKCGVGSKAELMRLLALGPHSS